MKHMTHSTPYWLATFALGASIAIAPAHAQSPNQMPQTAAPSQGQAQDQDVDRTINREAPRDSDRDDLTRRQLANFDQFLDQHPEVAEQLRKDPSLVDNREFVDNHPALQSYLREHPEIREDIKQNPNAVMHQEDRFDRQQDPDNHGINRTELANLDRFMDSHPEIAEQLRKDPSLADNKEFVQSHPALRDFLADHPGVREELKNNPNAFMHREDRFDQRQDQRNDQRNFGISRGELANMDHFMDSHPEIAEQLRKDPSLVDNKEFVENHPALRDFLADHPGVREEYRQHPVAFMHDEERFDRREDSTYRDNDVTRGELSSFHTFLQDHNNIASELSRNPSLATNHEYLENHPDLREYLQTNPQVHQELAQNPQSFLKSAQQFQGPSTTMPKPMAEPKVK